MEHRNIAGNVVPAIGLGCMNLSHAYGTPPSEDESIALLHSAIDLGVTHLDTAALYGFGKNEQLLGKALKGKRHDVFLASKCGMTGVDGKRVIDGRPQTLRATLEQSLRQLQTDVLDLYYLHRWDRSVPIEDSVGELSRLVEEGKIKAIGLSEVSASTIQKAHDVHTIAAVQSEYSLWSRNVEIAVLNKCSELGIALVAFSPLARGFLSGNIADSAAFAEGDIRKSMPRFQAQHLPANYQLLSSLDDIASELQCTKAQVALAWVLQQNECIHAIPGTTNLSHLKDNVAVQELMLTASQMALLDRAFAPQKISGPRYPYATQLEIDTEEF
ncbi:aldo/keto reductase [Alteromonas mediterranea]|uniref:Aldo/keto reductase n=1 Tax=Alteromonas mediterranea TaxID=314275 RepID=A0AAC9JBK6_9ALTE|nr:aldo/keto reductase [Alteromonas mediterranea]APD88387.1 aldo/keto reductase [Alteromonas mediterranea]